MKQIPLSLTLLFAVLSMSGLSCNNRPAEQSRNADPPRAQPDAGEVVERYPKSLPPVDVFPGIPYDKVVAYELNGRPGYQKAASVFQNRTGKAVELTAVQTDDFLRLINDRQNYGRPENACFDPGIGLVFYDDQSQIAAYLSLCLHCYNLYSIPPLELGLEPVVASGFSAEMVAELQGLFQSWGFEQNANQSK